MFRGLLRYAVAFAVGAAASSCGLLDPFPGGGGVEDAFGVPENGFDPNDGGGGVPQDPLVDPPVDESVAVSSEVALTVANPGEAFTVHLKFVSQNMNVVGGGIQFPGSDEIQWTLFENLRGQAGGDIIFGYVVDPVACDQVPALCHETSTRQFGVSQLADGRFAVSPPVEVPMVLKCATCASQSCQDVFDGMDSMCVGCQQPQACAAWATVCLDPMRPDFDQDRADLFEVFLGDMGALWSSESGCATGTPVCQNALDVVNATNVCEIAPP